jgi:hypothetical protein
VTYDRGACESSAADCARACQSRNRQAAAVRRDHVSTYQRVNRQAQKANFKSELRRAVVESGQRGAEKRLQLSVHLHV